MGHSHNNYRHLNNMNNACILLLVTSGHSGFDLEKKVLLEENMDIKGIESQRL